MTAESWMIQRLREWKRQKENDEAILRYWRALAAQSMQNAYPSQLAQQMQAQQNVEWARSQAEAMRPCTELELAKLAARGLRTETKPSNMFNLGLPLE